MVTISLCMIVKNEALLLSRCLDSIKEVADEIIIVDTGSTDNTVEIAKSYTQKVYHFDWIDDFSAARNFSFDQATKDYILWLDADDYIKPKDLNKIKRLKKVLSDNTNSVYFNYDYAFDDFGNPTLTFKRERLVKNNPENRWVGFVHEYIDTQGEVMDISITVSHGRVHGDSDRNLNIYRKKIKEEVPFSTRDVFYYAKELYYHNLFEEAISEFEHLLNHHTMWIEDRIDAAAKLADSYNALGYFEKAKKFLYGFITDHPLRAELLYRIGKTHMHFKEYEHALFWFNSIETLDMPTDTAGFIYPEYWGLYPKLEACVCYFEMGNWQDSYLMHKQTLQINKNHKSVQANEAFFESLE